jgi:hypothetical protein
MHLVKADVRRHVGRDRDVRARTAIVSKVRDLDRILVAGRGKRVCWQVSID